MRKEIAQKTGKVGHAEIAKRTIEALKKVRIEQEQQHMSSGMIQKTESVLMNKGSETKN